MNFISHLNHLATSREAELLMACAAECAIGRASERVSALASANIDWHFFLRMTAGHGLSAIASRALTPHASQVPADILATLHARHRTISARAMYLSNRLLTVVKILHDDGIDVIAFKGPTLATLAYDDPGLREFSDLDVLVQSDAIAHARRILIAHGYRPQCSNPRAIESSIFQNYEDTFVAADGVTVLDLHWRILPRYLKFLDEESLWARARPSDLRERTVTMLSTEDLLLFLCVHGAKHGWPLLSWICDLAGVVHRIGEIDWTLLASRADSVHSRRCLMLGLRLAHHLIGTAVPLDLVTSPRDDQIVDRLARRAINAMFRNFGDRKGFVQEIIIPLQVIESIPAKIHYLTSRALVPTLDDWYAMPLPSMLFPLYYVTRPFRLAFAQAKSRTKSVGVLK